MVFLVFPGLIGNVYGQIDTAMPDRFLNKDPYKLKLNFDGNQDINNNLNNRYYNSNNTRRDWPKNHGVGFGFYYQKAWYGGEISNYIENHWALIYPLAYIDVFFRKKFIIQIIIAGLGACEVNSAIINGDVFKGKFYGDYLAIFNLALGYEAFSNSNFSIIPNIGFQPRTYTVYPGSQSGIVDYGNPLTDFEISTCSIGLVTDYKILNLKNESNSYLSIRFKYDYCFTAKHYEYYNGSIHQFTIGTTFTWRDKKYN